MIQWPYQVCINLPPTHCHRVVQVQRLHKATNTKLINIVVADTLWCTFSWLQVYACARGRSRTGPTGTLKTVCCCTYLPICDYIYRSTKAWSGNPCVSTLMTNEKSRITRCPDASRPTSPCAWGVHRTQKPKQVIETETDILQTIIYQVLSQPPMDLWSSEVGAQLRINDCVVENKL